MARRPNVLFILIDQLRADLLHGGLADHVDLPNLRAFMSDAVCFRQHYSVCNPCGPSRTSILTGQYAMNHRSVRNGTPLRHDAPNLPSEIRKAGYQPLLFGYTDVTRDPRMYHPNDPAIRSYEQPMPGFDEVLEMRQEESYPWRAYLAAKGYDLPDYSRFYEGVPADGQARRLTDPAFYAAEDSDTAFLTDACLSHLKARGTDGWCAHLTYIRPHPPLVAPHPYNTIYDPASIPPPLATAATDHSFLNEARRHQVALNCVDGFDDLPDSDETARTLRAIYLGLATEVDHHIGRVLQFLKETGQYDDTLIVIGADHGEMLGDYGVWGKMNVFDQAYHVPLIIRDPQSKAAHGTVVDAFTESVDLMPTLLDWLGQPIPPAVNGRSLVPFLEGKDPETWRITSFSELDFGKPVTATPLQAGLELHADAANLAILRTRTHTLVQFAANLPPLLFERTDGGTTRNLAADPAHAGTLLRMTQEMLRHRMTHPDTTLSKIHVTADGPVTGL